MTRYEEARESLLNMSIMVAFCIATYLQRIGYTELENENKFKEFLDVTSDDIREWLDQEIKEKFCPNCGYKQRVIRKDSEEDLICPKCGTTLLLSTVLS